MKINVEENEDFDCNEENQKVHQENNCQIVNEIKNDDGSDDNTNDGNGNGAVTCGNFAQNPEDGDGDGIFDEDELDPLSLMP
jgi:hypothetical protein